MSVCELSGSASQADVKIALVSIIAFDMVRLQWSIFSPISLHLSGKSSQ